MYSPTEDPDAPRPGKGAARAKGSPESDRRCPWCGSVRLSWRKNMPSPNGPGILAYVFFPVAAMLWFSRTTYNECLDCKGRWQRGVLIEPKRPEPPNQPPPDDLRAGMYAEQVPTAAVVRRRPRLGQEPVRAPATGDVVLQVPPGSCRTCRQAGGRYDAKDVPAIPIAGCTCDGGCTCTIVPGD